MEFRQQKAGHTHNGGMERENIRVGEGEKFWRRRADSNRRIEVLQTSALTTWLRRLAFLL